MAMEDSLTLLCKEFAYAGDNYFINESDEEIYLHAEPKYIEDIVIRFKKFDYVYDSGISNGTVMKMKFVRNLK